MNAAYSEGLRNKVAEAKERWMLARKVNRAFTGTFPPSSATRRRSTKQRGSCSEGEPRDGRRIE